MRVIGKTTTFSLPVSRRKYCVLGLYLLFFSAFLYFGLQPAPVDASATSHLSIPSIQLDTPVETVSKQGRKITVPEVIAGAYSENPNKTLLLGHSNTVFQHLKDLQIGQQITFDNHNYTIKSIDVKQKGDIRMSEILSESDTPTLILMTCAGEHLSGHDYTHRVIITAQ